MSRCGLRVFPPCKFSWCFTPKIWFFPLTCSLAPSSSSTTGAAPLVVTRSTFPWVLGSLYLYIPGALKRNHWRPKCIWCSTLLRADASQSCKNRFSSAGNSLSSVCLLYSSLEKSKKGQKRIGNRRWQCLIFLFLLLDCCYQPLLYSI